MSVSSMTDTQLRAPRIDLSHTLSHASSFSAAIVKNLTSSSLPTTKSQLSTFTTSLPDVPRHNKLVVLIQTTSISDNNGNAANIGGSDTGTSETPPQGLHAYLALENLLFQSPSPSPNILPPPLLPTPSPSSLLPTLQTHLTTLTNPPSPPTSIPNPSHLLPRSHALLSHTTTSSPTPLPPHATNILSDLFPNFKALERACRTAEGRELLSDYLGEESAGRVLGFWERDRAVS
ncbi:MAG: hypothetical protein Q9160_005831 [Pyrenula sp. 1 TL-2023]